MYDAFVIYSQQDSAWVVHELRPQLETPPGGGADGGGAPLRLCIHQRDWLGGRDITDNVIQVQSELINPLTPGHRLEPIA